MVLIQPLVQGKKLHFDLATLRQLHASRATLFSGRFFHPPNLAHI
jgi:hypothetical protein